VADEENGKYEIEIPYKDIYKAFSAGKDVRLDIIY
jgi:hypothetical protein